MKIEDEKKAQQITVTLTLADADWLADHLNGWWEVSYGGLDEIEYFFPLLTTYRALISAGAADPNAKAVSE